MPDGPPVRRYSLYVDEELPEVREDLPWAIRDSQTADWALKRLGILKAEKEDIDGQFKKAVEMLEARRIALVERVQRGIDFFSANLVAFADANKRQLTDGKTRSRTFLHGRIGFRKQPDRIRVVDENLVIEWAKKQAPSLDLLRFKAELNRDRLNEYVKREGIIPDGCEFEEGHDVVRVDAESTPVEWNLPPLGAGSPAFPTPGATTRQALPSPGDSPGGDPASGEGPGEPALPKKVR